MRLKQTILATLAALVLVEGLASLVTAREPPSRSLALPPNQVVEYKTPDFQFQARTNRLGFRGPDFPVDKRDGIYRIAVLGNSFAYGWGLEFDETWPRQLERQLGERGLSVEIANLATPGTNPRIVSEIAKKAIPLLKPDLVVLAVLDGAAIVTYQPAAREERPSSPRQRLIAALTLTYPGTVAALQWAHDSVTSQQFIPASAASREWEKQARAFLARATADESRRFDAMSEAAKERFLRGNINAPLMIQALQDPGRFRDVVQSEALTEKATEEMRLVFLEAKELSGAAVAVSMPYAAYLGDDAQAILRSVGYDVGADLARIDPSRAARRAAGEAGIPFIDVTEAFRSRATAGMFIPFDGHYSAAGAKLFAELIAPQIVAAIRTGNR